MQGRYLALMGLLVAFATITIVGATTGSSPRTPWGEPDLQGMWPLSHLISTPFQRTATYGERRFLTDQEFAAAQKSANDRATRYTSGAVPAAADRPSADLVAVPAG